MVAALYRRRACTSCCRRSPQRGIRLRALDAARAGAARRRSARFFRDDVLPVLTPLAIDVVAAVPAALVAEPQPRGAASRRAAGEDARRLAVVQVPAGLPRLVRSPAPTASRSCCSRTSIRAHLASCSPGSAILEAAVIRARRATPSSNSTTKAGARSWRSSSASCADRRRSGVVRLEDRERRVSEQLLALLRAQLDVDRPRTSTRARAARLARAHAARRAARRSTSCATRRCQPVTRSSTHEHADLFAVLDERDVLLHHPYESFDPVVALVAQAADDPDVLAIKQTLYRTSGGSPIVASAAARRRARQAGDGAGRAARPASTRSGTSTGRGALEEAGATSIYGMRGYKTHAKICLVVRRGAAGPAPLRAPRHRQLQRAHRAALHRLRPAHDVAARSPRTPRAFFSALTGYSDPPRLKKLVMAPTGPARAVPAADRPRAPARAESGQPAEIIAKMNSLIDEDIIAALYAASRGGVTHPAQRARRSARCGPGVPGTSETIEVVSIVDRFLEHSRIYLLPQRRRRGGLPGERRLDDAQPRQARSS